MLTCNVQSVICECHRTSAQCKQAFTHAKQTPTSRFARCRQQVAIAAKNQGRSTSICRDLAPCRQCSALHAHAHRQCAMHPGARGSARPSHQHGPHGWRRRTRWDLNSPPMRTSHGCPPTSRTTAINRCACKPCNATTRTSAFMINLGADASYIVPAARCRSPRRRAHGAHDIRCTCASLVGDMEWR